MNSKRNLAINSLEVLALCSFAFAQPLFDLISRNAGFFVARKSEPLDIILFVLGLCFIPPLLIVLFEIATSALWLKFQESFAYWLRRHQEMKTIPPIEGGAGVNVALETRRTPPSAPLDRGDFQRKIHAII